uniref:Uncharacterized protein n=1 Tax=Anguilla anguilla TaxID=7936 RepID=A0A0E9WTU5_ANGAN
MASVVYQILYKTEQIFNFGGDYFTILLLHGTTLHIYRKSYRSHFIRWFSKFSVVQFRFFAMVNYADQSSSMRL